MPSLPWSTASVMYTPLLPSTQIDQNSAAIITRFNSGIFNSQGVQDQINRGVGPSYTARGRTPIWVVDGSVPAPPVPLDTGPWADSIAAAFAEGIPIPPGATEPATGDGALCVYRTTDKTVWEMFKAQKKLHYPQLVSSATGGGGSLAAGTYHWKVTSVNANGETDVKPFWLERVVANGSTQHFTWSASVGSTAYRIYRGPSSTTTTFLDQVSGGVTAYTDIGTLTPSGLAPPVVNTATTPEWRAAYGGRMKNVDTSPGHFRDIPAPGGGLEERFTWGNTATRIAVTHGIITKQDMEAGVIAHAVSLGAPNVSSIIRQGMWAYPAQDSDGKYLRSDGIVEGSRLRLPPDFNVDSIVYRWPVTRMLVVAAKEYGIFVHDGSAGTTIYCESPEPYELAGQGSYVDQLIGPTTPARKESLIDFPWSQLQVTRMTVCSNSSLPCTITGQGSDRAFTPRGMASDAFNDITGTDLANHASASTGWVKHPAGPGGSMQIADYRARTAVGRATYYSTFVPPDADYAVEADLTIFDLVAGGNGFAFELWLRTDIAVDTGYMFGYVTGDQQWKIRKVVSGLVTVLSSSGVVAPPPGDYLVRFEVSGSTLNAYVNGVQVVTATDLQITAIGRPAIGGRVNSLSGSGMHLDAVYIIDVDAAPPPPPPPPGTVLLDLPLSATVSVRYPWGIDTAPPTPNVKITVE